MTRAFTLLEVLVAMTIVALAAVALMQAASQAMRLLHQADDYQQAAMLADRVARDTTLVAEGVDTGQEGRFRWERRVRPVPVPETAGLSTEPAPRLHAVSVAVRWGRGRALEIASLRTVVEPAE